MKKIIVLILIVVFLMISFGCTTIAENSPGPAPDSGDGIPDGSGFEPDDGSPSDSPFGTEDAKGPAPNAGLGLSDGPGW